MSNSHRIEFSDDDRFLDFVLFAVADVNGDGAIEFQHVVYVESIVVWFSDRGHNVRMSDFTDADRAHISNRYDEEIKRELERAIEREREERMEGSHAAD